MGARRREQIIDTGFTIVSGPRRVGDEHPTRKGWFLTDRTDRHGNPLWYKPPGKLSRGFYLWGLWTYRLMFGAAVSFGVIGMGYAALKALLARLGF